MNTVDERFDRRKFLKTSSKIALAGMAGGGFGNSLASSGKALGMPPLGKAEHCIFLWLGGGVAQIDTWDPKHFSKKPGVEPGSYYPSIETSVDGIRVCEHLPRVSRIMERLTIVRTLTHEMKAEHSAATMRVHTGRPTTGTIRYPSIGSIVANQRGSLDPNIPAYVVEGLPSASRDPGFLGPEAGYLYVTNTESGPNSLRRHPNVDDQRQFRRESLLASLRSSLRSDEWLGDYGSVVESSLKLAGPGFMGAFDLESESSQLRADYGPDFGQRCLLARRMVERGVRFVEVAHNMNFVNGTGWDTHQAGQLKQHILIKELDDALSSLVLDLEAKDLLDKTLVVVATEFGRPGRFDGGGGRSHHPNAFSVVFAGGGLRHGQAVGVTDDLAENVLEREISVPDFLATICAGMGINPAKELHTPDNRPVPITDGGRPIRELFS